jgi:hypothetical protein
MVVKLRKSSNDLVFELLGTMALSLKRAAIQAVDFGDRMPNGTEEQERRSQLMRTRSQLEIGGRLKTDRRPNLHLHRPLGNFRANFM